MRWLNMLVLVPALCGILLANEEFFAAARRGDVETLKAHLEKGLDVNTKWRYDQTALIIASSRGHVEAVKLLLDRGAAFNIKDSFYGVTPLGASSGFGTPVDEAKTIAVASMLIQKGAADKDQFLIQSARAGKTNVVKALLPVTTWTPQTLSSALTVATAAKKTDIQDLLKAAGATPPPEIRVDAATLAGYAGSYEGTTDKTVVRIDVVEGKLTATVGTRPFALRPVDTAAFEPEQFPGSQRMVFVSEGDKVTAFELHVQGQVQKYMRVAGGAR